MNIKAGSTNKSIYLVMLGVDGLPATGLNITDLDFQYTRDGAEPSTKVDATALADQDSAHSDNTAIEIDATSSL